jgi:acetyltransferase-like isoleucine patch superfamily enzyme
VNRAARAIYIPLRLVWRGGKSLWVGAQLLKLRAKGVRGGRPMLHGKVLIYSSATGSITLGEGVVLAASTRANSLEARGPVILRTLTPGASIVIGDDSGLTSSTISASTRVVIGRRVLIGSGVLITDSDHHVVRPDAGQSRRHLGLPKPNLEDRVVIEDDVFVGARSIILKGVRIGEGSVIGAGSVVSSDVPPYSIAAGNPCRVVGDVS